MAEWQPISTAPKNMDILVSQILPDIEPGKMTLMWACTAMIERDGAWDTRIARLIDESITHWMPIPDEPSQ